MTFRHFGGKAVAVVILACLAGCSGVQSPCEIGSKVSAHVERLSGVMAFACVALGGDSEKCQRATGAVDLAVGAVGGLCL